MPIKYAKRYMKMLNHKESEDKMRKSQKVKLEEYMRHKAEDRKEQDRLKNSQEYQPGHPDNK